MAEPITIQKLIEASMDSDSLEILVNGDENAQVTTRLGETYPSAKKAISQMFQNGGLPATPFATKALMTASALADGQYAMVTDDTVNNGLYLKTAGAWVKSSYDPVSQAATYTDNKTKLKVEGAVGKNLFNKTKVTSGLALNDAGTTFNSTGRNVSSYIPVKPNTVYSFSDTKKAAFYDTNKVFVQLVPVSAANVTSVSTAAFVRIDIEDSNLDTAQIELGAVKTPYESYRLVMPSNSVDTSALQDNIVSSAKLQTQSVSAKHFADATFLNMFDIDTMLIKGVTLSTADGRTLTPITTLNTTEYIPCKPNTQYVTKDGRNVYFYTEDKGYISYSATSSSFTTPASCYYVRFNLSDTVTFRFQLNEGAVLPAVIPQPYKFTLDKLYVAPKTNLELGETTARKYNFTDAWIAWRDGQKFPICFLGDSTTNGNGTTGLVHRDSAASLGQDYITAPNAYPQLFENYIRDITGNTVMRAYNAGFSGRNSGWALDNIAEIMGGAYADSKMVGIAHGINDRSSNPEAMARLFKSYTEGLIKWLYEHGYQPFMITTQPTTMPAWSGKGTGSDIAEISNNIKKDLADKYGLELIDVNKYGEQFAQYSSKPLLNNIMESGSNVIHYGDGGHKFTAGLVFAHFCKRCIWTYNDGERLDYATQLQKSDIEYSQLNQLSAFKHGFKNEVLTTAADSADKLYQEYWVFNAGRKQLDLSAYYANAVVGQYVLVDGVQTTITTQGQELGTLDLGLHKIKAYSSATTALDWLGFKLTPTA